MARRIGVVAMAAALVLGPTAPGEPPAPREPVETIVVCAELAHDGPRHVWDAVRGEEPDLTISAGGMIRVEAIDQPTLRGMYARVNAIPGLAKLRQESGFLGAWNDGEYGCGGCGAENQIKRLARLAFLEFLRVPKSASDSKKHGTFAARLFGPEGRRIHVVVLDTLYYRDPPQRSPAGPDVSAGRPGPFEATEDPGANLLGKEQWTWLEQEMRRRADLRIIVSADQVLAGESGHVSWSMFPRDRERLLGMLRASRSRGVLLLSGGRGHGEISRLELGGDAGAPATLHEITVGSLNHELDPPAERNSLRVGDAIAGPGYGVIEIDWDAPGTVTIGLRDDRGEETASLAFSLDPPAGPAPE